MQRDTGRRVPISFDSNDGVAAMFPNSGCVNNLEVFECG